MKEKIKDRTYSQDLVRSRNIQIFISILFIVIAIAYTISVKFVDLGNIGPNGTYVGYSTINSYMANLIGNSMMWYKITKHLGIIPLMLSSIYFFIGFKELIKRKSIFKVDTNILLLGLFYIVVIGIYIFFEKVVINYRPILIDNKLEASYPSSHTLLAICMCGSSIMVNKFLIEKNLLSNVLKTSNKINVSNIFKIENFISIILIFVIVIGRLISGVHWFTDIIGGIIISNALLKLFNTILNNFNRKNMNNKK